MRDLFHIETCTRGYSTSPPPEHGPWRRFTGQAIEGHVAAEAFVANLRATFPHMHHNRIRIVEWAELQQIEETLTEAERADMIRRYVFLVGVREALGMLQRRRAQQQLEASTL